MKNSDKLIQAGLNVVLLEIEVYNAFIEELKAQVFRLNMKSHH